MKVGNPTFDPGTSPKKPSEEIRLEYQETENEKRERLKYLEKVIEITRELPKGLVDERLRNAFLARMEWFKTFPCKDFMITYGGGVAQSQGGLLNRIQQFKELLVKDDPEAINIVFQREIHFFDKGMLEGSNWTYRPQNYPFEPMELVQYKKKIE